MLASVGRLVRLCAQTQTASHVATGLPSTDRRLPAAVDFNGLQVELYRSRRSGRPLALVAAPMHASDVLSIGRELRVTDRLWHTDGRACLLLPESDRSAAERLVGRLEQLGLLLSGTARVVVFPDDALTIESLLSAVAIPTSPASDEGRWASDMRPAASRVS
jgi:hypothetical protein